MNALESYLPCPFRFLPFAKINCAMCIDVVGSQPHDQDRTDTACPCATSPRAESHTREISKQEHLVAESLLIKAYSCSEISYDVPMGHLREPKRGVGGSQERSIPPHPAA